MDMVSYTRFFIAFIFVIGLMFGLSWLARRFMPGAIPLTEATRHKRLKLIEILPVDGKRRLVLLKRDNVEHLILLGQGRETIIENNISSPLDGPKEKKNNTRRLKA